MREYFDFRVDFWNMIHHTNKVSANILSDQDVTVENMDGKRSEAIRKNRRVSGSHRGVSDRERFCQMLRTFPPAGYQRSENESRPEQDNRGEYSRCRG